MIVLYIIVYLHEYIIFPNFNLVLKIQQYLSAVLLHMIQCKNIDQTLTNK